jgi:hypothetical protein
MEALVGAFLIWVVFAGGIGALIAVVAKKVQHRRKARLLSAVLWSVLLPFFGWVIVASRLGSDTPRARSSSDDFYLRERQLGEQTRLSHEYGAGSNFGGTDYMGRKY